jgi:hypothetical protein
MSKMAKLQEVLRQQRQQSEAPLQVASSPVQDNLHSRPKGRQAGREGQVNISCWMNPAFKSSLRPIQAAKGPSCQLQDLMAEAFNDLFDKYNVPTVRMD